MFDGNYDHRPYDPRLDVGLQALDGCNGCDTGVALIGNEAGYCVSCFRDANPAAAAMADAMGCTDDCPNYGQDHGEPHGAGLDWAGRDDLGPEGFSE